MSDVFLPHLLRQKAVYWDWTSVTQPDIDISGQRIFDGVTPIEITCRYERKSITFLAQMGAKVDSNDVAWVDRDLVELGLLWVGRLADLPYPNDPFKNEGIFEIRKFDKIPSLKADKWHRIAYLFTSTAVGTSGQSPKR